MSGVFVLFIKHMKTEAFLINKNQVLPSNAHPSNNLTQWIKFNFLKLILKSRNVTPLFTLNHRLAVHDFSIRDNFQERNPRERRGIPVYSR